MFNYVTDITILRRWLLGNPNSYIVVGKSNTKLLKELSIELPDVIFLEIDIVSHQKDDPTWRVYKNQSLMGEVDPSKTSITTSIRAIVASGDTEELETISSMLRHYLGTRTIYTRHVIQQVEHDIYIDGSANVHSDIKDLLRTYIDKTMFSVHKRDWGKGYTIDKRGIAMLRLTLLQLVCDWWVDMYGIAHARTMDGRFEVTEICGSDCHRPDITQWIPEYKEDGLGWFNVPEHIIQRLARTVLQDKFMIGRTYDETKRPKRSEKPPPDAINTMLTQNGYVWERKLGSGAFGITYLVVDAANNHPFAIKVIQAQAQEIKAARAEIDVLKIVTKARPEFMAKYVQSFIIDDFFVCIVSEYIQGPTMVVKMSELWEMSLDDRTKMRRMIMKQMLLGLQSIHNQGYAHMDIKPENIMFDEHVQRIKFIDFGLACFQTRGMEHGDGRRRDTCTSNSVGTPSYKPPESVTAPDECNLIIAQAHDMWSLAMVFSELCSRNRAHPFQHYHYIMAKDKDVYFQRNPMDIVVCEDDISVGMYVNMLVKPNWKERPTITEAIELFYEHVIPTTKRK